MLNKKVDLHTHTNHSDGVLRPFELVRRAYESGISVLSITDHDSVDGFAEACDEGDKFGMEIISGVELSATLGEKDIHILGYFFDVEDRTFKNALSLFKRERFFRAERIVRKLQAMDVPLTLDSVLEKAGNASVGRPHIAMALFDEGYTETYFEAFEKYIGDYGPAHEPKYRISPEDAISFIANAGGISILAHPSKYISDDELAELIRAGVDGIEVIHPSHSPDRTKYYRGIVSEYFLLEGGGSDFHGGKRNDDHALGIYTIDIDKIEAMKRRLFIQ